MSPSTHRVAVIGGDGIGPEVLAEALKVVAAAGVTLTRPTTMGRPTTWPPARCCPTRCWTSSGASTPSCSGRWGQPSATPRSPRGPSSGASCCACASSSTCT